MSFVVVRFKSPCRAYKEFKIGSIRYELVHGWLVSTSYFLCNTFFGPIAYILVSCSTVTFEKHVFTYSLLNILHYFSVSKEFLDTQRLAMHAFMSRKGGLRAQHLGLLKAICVMLGWNSVIPANTPRWFPETLSTTEASAQKQDLIIWPPVVIVHNISILDNNSNGQGPTTEEALGQYLRGILFFWTHLTSLGDVGLVL